MTGFVPDSSQTHTKHNQPCGRSGESVKLLLLAPGERWLGVLGCGKWSALKAKLLGGPRICGMPLLGVRFSPPDLGET